MQARWILGVSILGFPNGLALAQTESSQKGFDGVDLFGSEQIVLEDVEERLGGQLVSMAQAHRAQDFQRFGELKTEIRKAIDEMGDFAYVELSVIQYFSEGRPIYLTVDLVDRDQAERRMKFLPEPKGSFEDPGGILAKYAEYESIGWELLRGDGLPPDPEGEKRAFHSTFGFAHPRLAPFAELFPKAANESYPELAAILHEDRNAERRAQAAFVLAYSSDGERLVKELLPAIFDPSSLVRNNVLRVFAEMVRNHPAVPVPIDPILKALDLPSTTDRNKASAILATLSEKPEHRMKIVKEAGDILLAMLRLKQPNNRDFAFEILKNVSGESFGDYDYDAFADWVAEHREDKCP